MYRFYGYAIEDTSHIENNYERAVKFCNANGLDVKLIKQLFYFDGVSSKEIVAVEEPAVQPETPAEPEST
jgi:hypothetical protein